MRRLAELNIFAKQGRTLSLKASIISFFGILLVVSGITGYWRADLLQAEGDTAVSTTQMGDAILAALSASL